MSRRQWSIGAPRYCPFCGAVGRIAYTPTNALRLVVNTLVILLWLVMGALYALITLWPQWPGRSNPPLMRLQRWCSRCKGKYIAGMLFPVCGGCGYDLTGNNSGTCPECGWQLPPIVRVAIRHQAEEQARSG